LIEDALLRGSFGSVPWTLPVVLLAVTLEATVWMPSGRAFSNDWP